MLFFFLYTIRLRRSGGSAWVEVEKGTTTRMLGADREPGRYYSVFAADVSIRFARELQLLLIFVHTHIQAIHTKRPCSLSFKPFPF